MRGSQDARTYKRYAVYHVPNGPLAAFGARWLGWDMVQGQPRPHPQDIPLDVANLTKKPRKYGLHATIKAPFRLAPGQSALTLAQRTADLCRDLRPVALAGLALSRMDKILVLSAPGDAAPLQALAAKVVQDLDGFRAPMTEAEHAKRLRLRLSPIQKQHLETWGYPHVMDQFNFHITLTRPLPPPLAAQVDSALNPLLTTLLPHPYSFDSLSLAGEDQDGFFHEIERFTLS